MDVIRTLVINRPFTTTQSPPISMMPFREPPCCHDALWHQAGFARELAEHARQGRYVIVSRMLRRAKQHVFQGRREVFCLPHTAGRHDCFLAPFRGLPHFRLPRLRWKGFHSPGREPVRHVHSYTPRPSFIQHKRLKGRFCSTPVITRPRPLVVRGYWKIKHATTIRT